MPARPASPPIRVTVVAAELRTEAPLAASDRNTYYGGGATGYTDYPSL